MAESVLCTTNFLRVRAAKALGSNSTRAAAHI